MSDRSRWKLRVTNNCLFIDDTALGKVMLQQNARPGLRPYIHPLRIPAPGSDATLCLTEDSPWHHPWQHGIQTGFHGVNGCDFWFDPGQHPSMVIGTIEPSTPRITQSDPPGWSVEAIWRHADGELLLAEKQCWSFQAADDLYLLDLDWTLQAIPDVQIEQHAYGGLFIRMPFRRAVGASVVNAAGQRDDETEQQPAKWADLHMGLENSETGAGIALLDHPANPSHPVHWRVDGQRGINPAPCITGAIALSAGAALRCHYRLVLHPGPLAASRIDALWAAYASLST
ncbi:MAG: DUF6807 family protein [Caldilineaceae bacterium]